MEYPIHAPFMPASNPLLRTSRDRHPPRPGRRRIRARCDPARPPTPRREVGGRRSDDRDLTLAALMIAAGLVVTPACDEYRDDGGEAVAADAAEDADEDNGGG